MRFDPNVARLCVATSGLLMGLLGVMHVALTLFTNKLEPTDRDLADRLNSAAVPISPAARYGRAVIGFNLSHSVGAILFAAIYVPLAWHEPRLLQRSVYLQSVGAVTLGVFILLARRYWFSAPLRGIALAAAFYGAGMIGLYR
jgi:hypothetical protein